MSDQQAVETEPQLARTSEELASIAGDAYVFGYPLVLMDLTRERSTPPMNRFVHRRAFPEARFREVVSPNADTLYSTAWIDLTGGPVVLGLPEMKGRYYLMQLLDAWTNVFAAPGTRTTGDARHDFALVGPGWTGTLPPGLERIDAPTSTVWLIGRTYTAGRDDYRAVHALQDRYHLVPLARWGQASAQTPEPDFLVAARQPATPAPVSLSPVAEIDALDAHTFFDRLARLMGSNPPAPADRPLLERMARIGLHPGRAFDSTGGGLGAPAILTDAIHLAQERIARAFARAGTSLGGWRVNFHLGRYGTSYLDRAAVARVGLGANLPEDAVYASTDRDERGRPLDGRHRYQLRFAAGELPPVKAFWSVTAYDREHFFVDNPIDRHALGDRDPLRTGRDGSITLLLQPESPGGDEEANWLPTPEGPFNLVLRLYQPDHAVLDRQWKPPPIRPAPETSH